MRPSAAIDEGNQVVVTAPESGEVRRNRLSDDRPRQYHYFAPGALSPAAGQVFQASAAQAGGGGQKIPGGLGPGCHFCEGFGQTGIIKMAAGYTYYHILIPQSPNTLHILTLTKRRNKTNLQISGRLTEEKSI